MSLVDSSVILFSGQPLTPMPDSRLSLLFRLIDPGDGDHATIAANKF